MPQTNVGVTQGSGKNIDGFTTSGTGNVRQSVVVADSTTDANVASVSAAGALKVDNSAVTQPVSAASLPLPSGASTSAKQPALGTAGSASADVLSVQGVASMTALKVDGSAVTQPVSGTVTITPSGTQTVTGTVTANQGGTWTVQPGNTANTTAWKVDGSAVTQPVSLASVPSHAVTNAGTFAVQATVAAAATNIAKAEDVASADGDVGVPAMAIRKATPGNTSGTDGDYEMLQMSAGRLWTSSTIDAALPAGTNVIGALSANQSSNIAQLAGTTTDTNSGVKSAGTLRVVLATDQPALTNKLLVTPDSVALPANQSVNVSQMNGVTVSMGSGIMGTGVQRVAIASDNDAVTVKQATGTNLHTVSDSGTITTVSTVTNLSQLGGTAIAMNTGTRSAGTQRVTIATDDVVPASQSGTWTVQPGNTPNSTAWLVSTRPGTSGGYSISHIASAGSTNATNIKASAGQVFGWYIYNSNAAARKVAFHNTAGTPTAGASVLFSIVIPPTSAANVFSETGIAFSTGIAVTMVTGLADSDNAAVAANDLICNIFYA